jgi:hypothetical protein
MHSRLIHPSSWNRYSRKFISKILHKPAVSPATLPPVGSFGPGWGMHVATRLDGYARPCMPLSRLTAYALPRYLEH